MKAIGYRTPGGIDRDDSLLDLDLPEPVATGRDLLIEIRAVSVNPVDTKVRAKRAAEGDTPVVLGWDAAGVVRAAGPEAIGFSPGDEVYYAGAIQRPGTNAELHLVDSRIVAAKPRTLDFAAAAALPLTAITAWEALFDRLEVTRAVPGAAPAVLIIGGAGGVGSIAVQLLRARTDLLVIATASRPETADWVRDMGAHYVIDHSQPLAPQVAALGIGAPGLVFSTTHTDKHLADIAELIAPQGRFALIDDPAALDIVGFKQKAVSVHWELMFTRPLFETPDMSEQGMLLDAVAKLVDTGVIRSTLTERLAPMDAANLKRAHALIESGKAKGKVVIERI